MGAIALWESRDLHDTVVGVTGGTSGIGRAACRQLVAAGARVVVAGRRKERLEEITAELGSAAAVGYQDDVRSSEQAESLVAAAGFGAYGSILDYPDDYLQDMIVTNVAGPLWSVRAAVRHFVERGGGDIVIVASVAGLRGGADEAVYASTKFAQVGMAGALDRELTPKGIRVTAICPAGVETEFAIGRGRTAGDPELASVLRPEDVASAVVTVLSQPRRVRTGVWTMWPMAEQS